MDGTKRKTSFEVGTLFAFLLAWISLAGLADDVVTWKRWFEVGVMEHWRAIKNIIGVSLFDLIDRDTPAFFFEKLAIALILLRAFYKVDAKNNLDGMLFYSYLVVVFIIFMAGIIVTYYKVYISRPWLAEYIYTVPALNMHKFLFDGTVFIFLFCTIAYFGARYLFGMSNERIIDLDSEWADGEIGWFSLFVLHFGDLVLWIFVTALAALLTIFIASDLATKALQ